MSQPTALLPGERRILRLDEVEAKSGRVARSPSTSSRLSAIAARTSADSGVAWLDAARHNLQRWTY